jgi:hypothetical protein
MSLVEPGRVFAPQQLPALFAAVAAVQLLVVYATAAASPAGAVAGVRTEGQRLSLRLVDERLVPVGRTFSAAARARFARGRDFGPPGRAPAAGEGRSTAGGA